MDTDTSENIPSALAIAILGQTAMEHLHQVAERIRENIDELLAEEERRQHKTGSQVALTEYRDKHEVEVRPEEFFLWPFCF